MNRKILSYILVREYVNHMQSCVNQKILQGWQPFGGVSTYKEDCAQAMVKYAPEECGHRFPEEYDSNGFEIPSNCTICGVRECAHQYRIISFNDVGEVSPCVHCGKLQRPIDNSSTID